MASSVEVREPLLDHRLIELSFTTDAKARIAGGRQRMFMKAAAEALLPPSILQRPKKTIVDPQRTWLRDELREWALDVFHDPRFRSLGVFDSDEVLREYDRYCNDGCPRTSFHIFQFLNVFTWFRTCLTP